MSFIRSNKQVRDPVTRHAVFEAARVLHDSLDSLSSDDDRRQITRLIVRYVQLVGLLIVWIHCRFIDVSFVQDVSCALLARVSSHNVMNMLCRRESYSVTVTHPTYPHCKAY